MGLREKHISQQRDTDLAWTMGNKLGKAGHPDERHKSSRFDLKANTPDERLLIAVFRGDSSAALDAICAGANCDWRGPTEFGGTALHAAAMRGHADMVEMLVTGGCSIDAKERKYGRTPLMEAAHYGHANVIRALIEVSKATQSSDGSDMTQAMIEACDDEVGRTALAWAADKGSLACVEALIDAGANVNAADKAGKTALHCAASTGQHNVVDALVSAGAAVDATSKSGRSALHLAAHNAATVPNNDQLFNPQASQLPNPHYSLGPEDKAVSTQPYNSKLFVNAEHQQVYDMLAARGWSQTLADNSGIVASPPARSPKQPCASLMSGDPMDWDKIHAAEAFSN